VDPVDPDPQHCLVVQVAMTDKRTLQDPERQRLVQQQIMMNYQVQPSQVQKNL
jgi:hypothetical protein